MRCRNTFERIDVRLTIKVVNRLTNHLHGAARRFAGWLSG